MAQEHDEPPIKELDEKFQELIEVEYGDDFKATEYESKDELENAFHSIMTSELADYYLDRFFKFEDGEVYVLPQDGPLYINFDEEYQLEEQNENHYKLTQENEDEMRGEYTLSVQYEHQDGEWLMIDRNEIVGVEEGDELPETASSFFFWALMGLGIALSGAGIILFSRKNKAGFTRN